jgi:hypothetical protein
MNMFLKILIVKEVHLYAALPASIGFILLIITGALYADFSVKVFELVCWYVFRIDIFYHK